MVHHQTRQKFRTLRMRVYRAEREDGIQQSRSLMNCVLVDAGVLVGCNRRSAMFVSRRVG